MRLSFSLVAGHNLVRSAGAGLRLINTEGKYATLKMPSGEVRLINANCRATIGTVGNTDHQKQVIGKAGRNRWKGRRPRVPRCCDESCRSPNGRW